MSNRAVIDVFIIDNHTDFRHMLVDFFKSKNISCRDFADPIDAINSYAPAQVGCVIVDIKMSHMSGIQVTKKLKAIDPLVPIIAITGYSNISDAVATIKNGAIDYVEKPFDKPFDINALYTKVIACLAVTDEVRKQRIQDSHMSQNFETLTFRERQILTLLAIGRSNKEIGLSLDISYRTVEGHRARIMEKLGASSAADLVRVMHHTGQ